MQGADAMRREMQLVVTIVTGLCVSDLVARAGVDIQELAQRLKLRYSNVPRKVLVFYYPWYGRRGVEGGSGRDAHWGQIDEEGKDIEASTNYPALGAYDSHDPKTIAQHCRWCKAAGVDGLFVSWGGRGDFSDRAMGRILDACAAAGLEATIYHETVPQPRNAAAAAEDILWVVKKYAGHKAWLKAEGKPVVFVYGRAVNEIGLAEWLKAAVLLNGKYDGGVALIGDQISAPAARIFDGVHTYNTAGALRGKDAKQALAWAEQTYPNWVGLADANRRISTLTIIPGYDDTKIRKPGLKVERHGGRLYEAQWRQAIAANPHWVLITSFNEWHEGSEIEPSAEDGRRYLEMTATYAAKFKALGKRVAPKVARPKSKITAKQKADLARRLNALKIGVLPDAGSAAVWWLVEVGVRPAMLTWEQLVARPPTAKQFDMLIYAAGERYRQTVKTRGDADAAIQGYLRSGGMLIALPSLPMPFHYNETDKAVGGAGKFGLPLSIGGARGGWETPPEGKELRFVAAKGALPSLPRQFDFPKAGDLRWRPLVGEMISAKARLTPLLELRDAQGGRYGHAAAFIRYASGPLEGGGVLYAWFGLLNEPALSEPLLHDLLRFAADRAAEK